MIPPTERTRIRRHPERAVPDEVEQILTDGAVGHVGFIDDGLPCVMPFSYHYDRSRRNQMYLHGSTGSRAMKLLATGVSVCVTVTLLDGLVYSRKAMNHSMNYRGAVVFGTAREVADQPTKARILDAMVQSYFPGRTLGHDYYPPSLADLAATTVIEVQIDEWSGKARRGGPSGPDDNSLDAPGSAGVIELREA